MKLIKLSFFALTICLSLVNVRVSARQSEVGKNLIEVALLKVIFLNILLHRIF